MILHWQCIIKASVVNGRLWNSNYMYTRDLLLNSSVEYDFMLKGYQRADICLSSAEGYLGMRSSQKKTHRLENGDMTVQDFEHWNRMRSRRS
jgi:hypothetical protein